MEIRNEEQKQSKQFKKRKTSDSRGREKYMPLRNKESKDYTMKDLDKLTSVLNSYRKSAKKRVNSESKGRSLSKKNVKSKERSVS